MHNTARVDGRKIKQRVERFKVSVPGLMWRSLGGNASAIALPLVTFFEVPLGKALNLTTAPFSCFLFKSRKP